MARVSPRARAAGGGGGGGGGGAGFMGCPTAYTSHPAGTPGVFVPVTGFLGNAPARQPTHRLGSAGAGGLYLRPWCTSNVWLTRCAQWGYTVKCSVEDA